MADADQRLRRDRDYLPDNLSCRYRHGGRTSTVSAMSFHTETSRLSGAMEAKCPPVRQANLRAPRLGSRQI